jgi:hypothetical protein
MITVLADGVTPLADNSFGDNLGDGVAGPVGLLIIVLLAIATVLLVRNMNKHLKRLPESFPDPRGTQSVTVPQQGADDEAPAGTVPSARDDESAAPTA